MLPRNATAAGTAAAVIHITASSVHVGHGSSFGRGRQVRLLCFGTALVSPDNKGLAATLMG